MPTRVLHRTRPGSMVRWRGSLTGAWLACTLVSGCALGQAAGGPPPAVEEKAVTNAPAEMIEAALDDAANRSTTARADIKVIERRSGDLAGRFARLSAARDAVHAGTRCRVPDRAAGGRADVELPRDVARQAGVLSGESGYGTGARAGEFGNLRRHQSAAHCGRKGSRRSCLGGHARQLCRPMKNAPRIAPRGVHVPAYRNVV